jgi:hypothetical protein
MNPPRALRLSLLSAVLALSVAAARADDPSSPPVPPAAPAAPETTPAEGQTPPPARHKHMRAPFVLGDLTAKLGLTPEQQKTVGAMIASNDSQLKALREDDSIAKEDKRANMMSIISATRGQIRAALTPDQQKIFDTLPTRGEHGGKPPATPPAPAT